MKLSYYFAIFQRFIIAQRLQVKLLLWHQRLSYIQGIHVACFLWLFQWLQMLGKLLLGHTFGFVFHLSPQTTTPFLPRSIPSICLGKHSYLYTQVWSVHSLCRGYNNLFIIPVLVNVLWKRAPEYSLLWNFGDTPDRSHVVSLTFPSLTSPLHL